MKNAMLLRWMRKVGLLLSVAVLSACEGGYLQSTIDPVTETFVNDDEANNMRHRAMREPWRL